MTKRVRAPWQPQASASCGLATSKSPRLGWLLYSSPTLPPLHEPHPLSPSPRCGEGERNEDTVPPLHECGEGGQGVRSRGSGGEGVPLNPVRPALSLGGAE